MPPGCRAFNKDKVAPRTNIMAEPFQRLAGKKRIPVGGRAAGRKKAAAGSGEGGLRESEEEAAEQLAAQVCTKHLPVRSHRRQSEREFHLPHCSVHVLPPLLWPLASFLFVSVQIMQRNTGKALCAVPRSCSHALPHHPRAICVRTGPPSHKGHT